MNTKDFLGKDINIFIDRKLGSKHPKHNIYYSINYGYVPNTISGDDEEIDAYLLGVFEPVDEYNGKCIAIIHRLDDNDDKLIVVPNDKDFSDEQIEVLVEFQERFFKHEIWR